MYTTHQNSNLHANLFRRCASMYAICVTNQCNAIPMGNSDRFTVYYVCTPFAASVLSIVVGLRSRRKMSCQNLLRKRLAKRNLYPEVILFYIPFFSYSRTPSVIWSKTHHFGKPLTHTHTLAFGNRMGVCFSFLLLALIHTTACGLAVHSHTVAQHRLSAVINLDRK